MTCPLPCISINELEALVGTRVGQSDWILIDQARINDFADVTEDHQYIHVDPDRARKTDFGGTVAHGFLTLSLLSHMVETGLRPIKGMTANVNYGFDKIRMLSPVPAGARVRGGFTLNSVTRRSDTQILCAYHVDVEVESRSRPALAADWLILTTIQQEVSNHGRV
jgi:acyl dehydratase